MPLGTPLPSSGDESWYDYATDLDDTVREHDGVVAALNERIDDRVAALLVAGSNITLTYDDTAGTLTIAAAGGTGGGLTQEQAEDIVAALIVDNSDLDWTYADNGTGVGSLVAVIKAGAVTNAMLAGGIAISKVTGLQEALDAKADDSDLATAQLLTANNQTGTTYTLVLADAGKVVERNNGSANTTTVPPNSSVAFPIGTVVEVWQQGAGTSSIVAGAGVTFSPADVDLTLEQGLSISLRKRATNEWAVTVPGEVDGLTKWVGSEADYQALATKDSSTIYFRTA